MKLFEYKNPSWGIAFTRISDALHKFAPDWVEWVQDYDTCDIALIHVVGTGEIELLEKPKPKVIIQHCYFTAGAPGVNYIKFWKQSILTVSFHNLPSYTDRKFPFYHMPWGADADMFKLLLNTPRTIKILATGHVAETEGIDKVFEAARNTGTVLYHTGHNFNWDKSHYTFLQNLNDSQFVELLNSVQYVSALRFIEGFELMAIEGLFCGARPIIPNDPTYDWYREYAYTIDRNSDIVKQLENIIKNPPRPILTDEYETIVQKFSWQTLIPNFYKILQEKLNDR